ncbi:anti-sigma factor antagonist [Streptomyces sp. NPDC048419]|uniref:anti-sigma factor antagonist n=1 Tax=Streptomyces sp. NPDC048419 TaxID=3365547 RepID=UPI00371B90CB
MTLHVDAAGDRLVVTISGELDLESDPLLQQTLSKALDRAVGGLELDLAGVDFCDCSTLNVLLDVRDRARLSDKQVTLRATSRAVQRLLTLTNTLALFAGNRTAPDGHPAPSQAVAGRTAPPAEPTRERAAPDAPTAHARRPHSTERTDRSHDGLAMENAQLHRAMQTRAPIDLARGMLMASFHLTPEQAWQVLVTTSQHSNTKLNRIADALVQTADGHTPLPEPFANHLATAVRVHNSAA